MINKLISLFLSTLILACPFNCMPESGDSVKSDSQSCCSHCQTKSQENSQSPRPLSSDCCQCLCAGAIHETSHQIDLTVNYLVWGSFTVTDLHTQHVSLTGQHNQILFDPDKTSGRQICCLQMSFQC